MRYTKTNKNYGPIEPITNSKKLCQNHRVEEINSSQLTQKVLEELGFLFRIKKIHIVKKHAEKKNTKKRKQKQHTRLSGKKMTQNLKPRINVMVKRKMTGTRHKRIPKH